MIRFVIATTALALSFCRTEAVTKIAVLEFGEGGTVHQSNNAQRRRTTVEGVTSFWGALHNTGRQLQLAGMSVLPDLFKKPSNGIVIGVTTGNDVNLKSMPFLNEIISNENRQQTVGVMEVPGSRCNALMSKVPGYEDNIDQSSIINFTKKNFDRKGFSGFRVHVEADDVAASIDGTLRAAINEIQSLCKKQAYATVVVHIVVDGVVDEEESASSHRRLSRELEDQQDNQAADGEAANDKEYNGYYGYGYYNDYGEWVTPFKTMFQIQYFNVVLWTSIGLLVTLFFTIYLMVFMPLEADTLLFGESAKFSGED